MENKDQKLEFTQKIKEINEWYELFSSFKEHEMSTIRKEIILENLLYQFINEEKKYEEYKKNIKIN